MWTWRLRSIALIGTQPSRLLALSLSSHFEAPIQSMCPLLRALHRVWRRSLRRLKVTTFSWINLENCPTIVWMQCGVDAVEQNMSRHYFEDHHLLMDRLLG